MLSPLCLSSECLGSKNPTSSLCFHSPGDGSSIHLTVLGCLLNLHQRTVDKWRLSCSAVLVWEDSNHPLVSLLETSFKNKTLEDGSPSFKRGRGGQEAGKPFTTQKRVDVVES